jgi:hypothetical protein
VLSCVCINRWDVWGDNGPKAAQCNEFKIYIETFCSIRRVVQQKHRETPINSSVFFRKKVFSLKFALANPPQNFWRVLCLNSESMWALSLVYNFNAEWVLENNRFYWCRSCRYVGSQTSTYKRGFTNENSFIQLCLTSTHFCKITKTAANHKKALKWVP